MITEKLHTKTEISRVITDLIVCNTCINSICNYDHHHTSYIRMEHFLFGIISESVTIDRFYKGMQAFRRLWKTHLCDQNFTENFV